jgi:hypothetical protein
MLGKFDSEKEESSFIAAEIKRCVANMGGILKWGDFVILRESTSAHIDPWPTDRSFQFDLTPFRVPLKVPFKRREFHPESLVATNFLNEWRCAYMP